MKGTFPGGTPIRPTFASGTKRGRMSQSHVRDMMWRSFSFWNFRDRDNFLHRSANLPVSVTNLLGTSAGSLCAAALSAIVQTMDGKSANPFTFDDLKSIVFNLTLGGVIDDSPIGIFRILAYNVGQGYLLDTSPLRVTLNKALDRMGYKYMSDLYLPTCISVVDEETGLPVRICSDDPKVRHVHLIDVLMASAAMPVVFPSQTIPGFVPPYGNGTFVDGGVGIDMIPTTTAYQRNMDAIYIITRQWEITSKHALPERLKSIKILANTVQTFNDLLQSAFLTGLSAAGEARIKSFAYIPVLPVDFGVLDFARGKVMYDMTRNWTMANAPLCLNCAK